LREFTSCHPEVSKRMSENGYNLIKENLQIMDVENYWVSTAEKKGCCG